MYTPPIMEESGSYGIIAHRGNWDASNPQNSLSAFKRALELNIYGTEMDVHQTKDGLIVVNHDVSFYGLPISETTYAELCKHTLDNGETIPLFEEFLQVKKNRAGLVKMIVELKSCKVNDLIALVDSYDLQNEVEYISFSANLCNEFVALGYGYKTYYLRGDVKPTEIKGRGYGGVDYYSGVFDANPSWIKESKYIGLKTIVWTVNNMEELSCYVQQGVLVTTDRPLEALEVLKQQ